MEESDFDEAEAVLERLVHKARGLDSFAGLVAETRLHSALVSVRNARRRWREEVQDQEREEALRERLAGNG